MNLKPLIVFTLFTLLLAGCISNQPDNKIRIGFQINPASTLIQVAAEKGFFAKNDLDVELTEFTAGKFAFQAMLAGSVDASVVGDVPITLAKMQGNEFYVLTEVVQNNNEAPVLVIDDGSQTPQEYFLKTKRKLSTILGGTPEFSTYLFLKNFGIPANKVEIIAQKPEDTVASITSGSVDAIAIFEPYPTIAEEILKGKTKRFELPSEVYPTAVVLAANKEWVDKYPAQAKSLLRALKEAEDFVRNNPEEAQQIVSKKTGFSLETIKKIWSDFDLRVRISDQLLRNLEMQADWAIETNKVNTTKKPDFSSMLRKDLLDSIQ